MSSPLHLVLDLETVEDDSLPPRDKPTAFPPPPYHRIVCAGFAWLEDYKLLSWGVLDEDERTILCKLTRAISDTNPLIVGMNSRGFDLPVIAARCLRHGVPHPWYYKTKAPRYRYAHTAHLDLMDLLSDYGAAPKASLDVWARLIGFPGKMGVSGANVAELLKTGGVAAVADYCMTDVAQTCALLLRVELVSGRLTRAAYAVAAESLLAAFETDERIAALAARVDRSVFLSPYPVADPVAEAAE